MERFETAHKSVRASRRRVSKTNLPAACWSLELAEKIK